MSSSLLDLEYECYNGFMKRRVRRNPIKSGFDCHFFNKALVFCFPEERDQRWWATELLKAVAKSQRRFDPSVFKPSLEMVKSGKGIKCGPLIKAIEKISRLPNGEEWLQYGLQGYLNDEWKKDRGADMLILLMSKDKEAACMFLEDALYTAFYPKIRKMISEKEAKQFFSLLRGNKASTDRFYYGLIESVNYDIKDKNQIGRWAAMAFLWTECLYFVCTGNTRPALGYRFKTIDEDMKEQTGKSLAEFVRKEVPQIKV